MFGKFLLFVVSLVLAPGLGLYASVVGTNELLASNEVSSIAEVAALCPESAANPTEGCEMFYTLQLLRRVSMIALYVSLGLPLFYFLSALALSRSRSALALCFPWLVRISLGILPLLLAAHGLLIWFGTYEGWQSGVIPGYVKVLIFLGILGFVLLLGAFGIVADMRKLLEPEPLRVTGVLLEKQDMPDLFARVARLADRLGSRRPERIVLGIEPTAFVANVHLRLRGVGDYPQAETLYLPTVALRVLEEAELDALIGHELGHFRGEDVKFSNRFAPAFRSLEIATDAVNDEGDDADDASSIALMPAVGLLAFMTWTLSLFVSRIRREREFVADQAAVEVSNPRATASLLVKFGALTLQWEVFRHHFTRLLRSGTARRNQSLDYILRTRQFIGAINQETLRKGLFALHLPHPLDSHPTLAQRTAALGVDPASVISSSLDAILSDRPAPHDLEAIEERITAIDAEFYRDPGDCLTVSEDPALPPELRYGTA